MILGSAEPFHGQRVENMTDCAWENVENRETPQRERETCLYGFDDRRAFRSSEMTDCAVQREMTLTSRVALGHIFLSWKLNELKKQERRARENLPRKSENLEIELKVAT